MAAALLVTRPEPEAGRTAALLAAMGVETVVAPVLSAKAVEATLPSPRDFAALAFTSAQGARAFVAREGASGFLDRPVYAVGERTAEAARAAGFRTVLSASGDFPGLVALMAGTPPGGEVLYPAARHRSGDLAGALAKEGIAVETLVVYEMVPETALPAAVLTGLESGGIGGALFYSRRTASVFAGLLSPTAREGARARLWCLCISSNCAAPLRKAGFARVALADGPGGTEMESLALAFARGQIKA